MKTRLGILIACLSFPAAAPALVLLETDFDGSTGHHVFSGNTDNSSGSSTLAVNWTTAPDITSVSGLSAISTGDSGTVGGFAVTQNGAGVYANANSVYLSRNMNLDGNRTTTRRGFSFTFTTATASVLDHLTVVAEHTTNTGSQNQSYTSDLHYRLTDGGAVDLMGSVAVDYASGGPWHTLVFADESGSPLPAGTYTLEIWMSNLSGGGAYAVFDGVTIETLVGPAIVDFQADDTYLAPGENTVLRWEVDPGAASVTIDPDVGDVTALTTNGLGSIGVSPTGTVTYTLTATDATGSNTASVTTFVSTPRPNLVLFLVDDMGPHDTSVPFTLDTNGVPLSTTFNQFYVTPNMETLAASGMRFVTAYAQSVCSPTRTGLMTGHNSARHAVSDWVGGGTGGGVPPNWRSSGMNASETTLPKLLQQGGYRTIHIGKAHFGEDPLNLGFDVNIGGGSWGHPPSGYIGTPGYGGLPGLGSYDGSLFLTEALTIEGNQAVENAVNEGVPFFLYMSLYAVHAPFTENPRAAGDYSASHSENHRKFATMIEGMDLALGEVRRKLIDLGVAEDTLMVFLGDNGSDSPATNADGLPYGAFNDFPMRGMKGSKWEGGIRVPMIFSWAATNPTNAYQQALPIPANSIETDLVTSWDLPTTLLGIADLPIPSGVGEDGYDLRPYLRATPGTHRPQELVIHYPHNHRSDFFSLIRQGDMKLIYNYQTNRHQLYDLAVDPTESNDLAGSQPDTVARMTRALAQRLDQLWGPQGVLKPTVASRAPVGNVVSIPADPGVDADGDGLSDMEEDPNLNGLVDGGEPDPDNPDSDDDLLQDGDELSLGLNPLDPTEYFQARIQRDATGRLQLSWPSQPGLFFAVRHSADLDLPAASWPVQEFNISAMPGDATLHTLPSTGGGEFFSVELMK